MNNTMEVLYVRM